MAGALRGGRAGIILGLEDDKRDKEAKLVGRKGPALDGKEEVNQVP